MCRACRRRPPAEVRLGLITTLSGELAESYGSSTVDAAKLALQPINDTGGLDLGGQKFKVTLVIEDDQDRAEVATRAAQKLINQDRIVALVGPSLSRNAIPVADVSEGARIPMISPNSTNPATTAGKKYVFRVDFIDPFQGRVIARFARDELHAPERGRPVRRRQCLQQGHRRSVQATYSPKPAVESWRSNRTRRAKRTSVRRWRASSKVAPTCCSCPTTTTTCRRKPNRSIRTASALRCLAPMRGARSSPRTWASSRVRSSQQTGPSKPPPRSLKRSSNAFGMPTIRPPNNIAALAYDSVGLLLTSLRTQGKADPDAIRTGLSGINDYAGATGTIGYGRGNGGSGQERADLADQGRPGGPGAPGGSVAVRFWTRSLMVRLVSYFLVLSLVTVSVVGYLAYTQATEALKSAVFDRLSALADVKEGELNRWMDDEVRGVVLIAGLPEVRTQTRALFSQAESDEGYATAHAALAAYLGSLATSEPGAARGVRLE